MPFAFHNQPVFSALIHKSYKHQTGAVTEDTPEIRKSSSGQENAVCSCRSTFHEASYFKIVQVQH
jgi:hypothetical protein